MALVVSGADHHTSETSVRNAHRRRALAIIEARFSDPELTSASLARAVRISERYLQRIFADSGETPLGVIRKRRIAEASRVIERRVASRKSIAEIAYGVGFLDPAYFSRVFRSETGVAPSDYGRK